jgi:hypothetical protein
MFKVTTTINNKKYTTKLQENGFAFFQADPDMQEHFGESAIWCNKPGVWCAPISGILFDLRWENIEDCVNVDPEMGMIQADTYKAYRIDM